MTRETTREAIRSLSAHPRWQVLIDHLTARREQLVIKMLKESGSDSDVIRLQGRCMEAAALLDQLKQMAAAHDDQDDADTQNDLIA